MNIPNVGPQLPVAQTPQVPIPAPFMPTPPGIQQLGCGPCNQALSDAVATTPSMPTWVKVLGALIFIGGIFGLVMYDHVQKERAYPEEP